MCKPTYYDVFYEINPWMSLHHIIDHSLANQQWEALKSTIESLGATVELIEPVKGWPDMVFTANAGLCYQHNILLSRFKHPERQGERQYFDAWFRAKGYQILSDNGIDFEGAGDALFAGEKLFAAYGFRSKLTSYENIKLLGEFKLIFCELVNAHFYHLDTCFCPLNTEQALWYPEAFSVESQRKIKVNINVIDIPQHDADQFACNAIVIDNAVIIPSGCVATKKRLEQKGFQVFMCEMSEFIKAGGACKCLTLEVSD